MCENKYTLSFPHLHTQIIVRSCKHHFQNITQIYPLLAIFTAIVQVQTTIITHLIVFLLHFLHSFKVANYI